ncbi:MAG: hypothetical protein ACXIUM_06820 [Wenzhouxiangella sp.]
MTIFTSPEGVPDDLPNWFSPAIRISILLVNGVLLLLIANARRWALVVSIVLYLGGAAVLFTLGFIEGWNNPDAEIGAGLLDSVVLGLQAIAELVAYGFLLTAASRGWFAEWRQRRAR